jgi:hypothetical protein
LEIGAGMGEDRYSPGHGGFFEHLEKGNMSLGHEGRFSLDEEIEIEMLRHERPAGLVIVLVQTSIAPRFRLVQQDLGDEDAERRGRAGPESDLLPGQVQAEAAQEVDALAGLDPAPVADVPGDAPDDGMGPIKKRQEAVEFALVVDGRDFHARYDLHALGPAVLDRLGVSGDAVVIGDADGGEARGAGQRSELLGGEIAVAGERRVDVEVDVSVLQSPSRESAVTSLRRNRRFPLRGQALLGFRDGAHGHKSAELQSPA